MKPKGRFVLSYFLGEWWLRIVRECENWLVRRSSVIVLVDKLRSKTVQANPSMVFESLFQEHWLCLYGVLFRLVGDYMEAEDLALEVFC